MRLDHIKSIPESTPFHASGMATSVMESLLRDLEVSVTSSNPRKRSTVPTWHVFYRGVRVLALDVQKQSILCRFLKVRWTPPELQAHPDWCRWRAPFWHGSKVTSEKSHRNYHLSFRCCKSLSSAVDN